MKLFIRIISQAERGKKDDKVVEVEPEIKNLISGFVEKMGANSEDVEKYFAKCHGKTDKGKVYMKKRAVIINKPEVVM